MLTRENSQSFSDAGSESGSSSHRSEVSLKVSAAFHSARAALRLRLVAEGNAALKSSSAAEVPDWDSMPDQAAAVASLFAHLRVAFPASCVASGSTPRKAFNTFSSCNMDIEVDEGEGMEVRERPCLSLQDFVSFFKYIVGKLPRPSMMADAFEILTAPLRSLPLTIPEGHEHDLDEEDDAELKQYRAALNALAIGRRSLSRFLPWAQLGDVVGITEREADLAPALTSDAAHLRNARAKEAARKTWDAEYIGRHGAVSKARQAMEDKMFAIRDLAKSRTVSDDDKLDALGQVDEVDNLLNALEMEQFTLEKSRKEILERFALTADERRVLQGVRAMAEAAAARQRAAAANATKHKQAMEKVVVMSTVEQKATIAKERAMLRQHEDWVAFSSAHKDAVKSMRKEFEAKKELLVKGEADMDTKERIMELDSALENADKSLATAEEEFVANHITLTVEEQRVLRGYHAGRKAKGHDLDHVVHPTPPCLPGIVASIEARKVEADRVAAYKREQQAAMEGGGEESDVEDDNAGELKPNLALDLDILATARAALETSRATPMLVDSAFPAAPRTEVAAPEGADGDGAGAGSAAEGAGVGAAPAATTPQRAEATHSHRTIDDGGDAEECLEALDEMTAAEVVGLHWVQLSKAAGLARSARLFGDDTSDPKPLARVPLAAYGDLCAGPTIGGSVATLTADAYGAILTRPLLAASSTLGPIRSADSRRAGFAPFLPPLEASSAAAVAGHGSASFPLAAGGASDLVHERRDASWPGPIPVRPDEEFTTAEAGRTLTALIRDPPPHGGGAVRGLTSGLPPIPPNAVSAPEPNASVWASACAPCTLPCALSAPTDQSAASVPLATSSSSVVGVLPFLSGPRHRPDVPRYMPRAARTVDACVCTAAAPRRRPPRACAAALSLSMYLAMLDQHRTTVLPPIVREPQTVPVHAG